METRKQCQLGVKIIRCRNAIDNLSHPPDQAVQNANQENLYFCSIKRHFPIYSANQNNKIGNDVLRVLQVGRSRVRLLMVSLAIFHSRNPSGRNITLGSTHPLAEISTRDIV